MHSPNMITNLSKANERPTRVFGSNEAHGVYIGLLNFFFYNIVTRRRFLLQR